MEGGGRREGGRDRGREGGGERKSEGVRDSLHLAKTHDYLCVGKKHTHILQFCHLSFKNGTTVLIYPLAHRSEAHPATADWATRQRQEHQYCGGDW